MTDPCFDEEKILFLEGIKAKNRKTNRFQEKNMEH